MRITPGEKVMLLSGCLMTLCWIGFWVFIGFVAMHFILKYW